MSPTEITVLPHELEPGDIITDYLGQRVGGYDPPSLLYYNGGWWVWSTLDKLICILDGGVAVEVIRNVADEIVAEGASQAGRVVSPHRGRSLDTAASSATSDACPPHGLARIRGLYMVVT